jgi:PAS domain S-box-containing protein
MRDEAKTPQQLLQELQSLRERLAKFERAEAEINHSQARTLEMEAHLLLLLEQLPVTVWATDRDLRITHSVGAGLTAIGLQPHQLVGQTLFQYFQTDDPDFWFIRHTRQALAGVSIRLESEWLGRHYQTRIEPLRKQNQIIGAVGVATDITELQKTQESLRHSEERFRQVAENIQEVIWMTDFRSRQVLYVSPAYERVWGHSCQSLYERPHSFLDAIHPDDRERIRTIADTQDRRQSTASEYRIVRQDGSVRWICDKCFPIRDDHGEVYRLVGIAEDITDRKRTEEALRRSEAEFRAMFELAGVGKGQSDPVTRRFLRVNRKMCEITGYSADELYGMTFSDITHPDDRDKDLDGFMGVLKGETKDYAMEKRYVRKDGTTIWIHVTVTMIRDADGSPLRSVAVIQEISARRRAEDELQGYASRLQDLSRRLMEVQEQERRHFARELHDEVGQALTGLNLALEAVARLPAERLRDGIAKAQTLAKETTAQVRELSLRLRPSMLDDLGLRPALLWHFNRYSTQTGVHVDFQVTGLYSRLPAEVETAAYRILQEALTNVARHAGVGTVDVRVRHEDGELFLAVEDKGVGFDAAGVRGTCGLSGMCERATLLGGQLTIESQPGAGTRLLAKLPCGTYDGCATNETDCRAKRSS